MTGREWPIVAGIPRFTSSEHLESFGRQWNRYEVAHDDEDRATFVAKTGVELHELRGLRCSTPVAAEGGTARSRAKPEPT